MSRHPLLPDRYSDSAMQAAILYALAPYKITERNDISNPRLMWDLSKAWNDSETVLAKSRWEYTGQAGTEDTYAGFTLSAVTDREIESLNVVIAGIVAHQMLDPDSDLTIRRIDHRKGGEVALIISVSVADALKEMFPQSRFIGYSRNTK